MKTNLEELLKNSVEQMHEGIQILSRNWQYLYINDAACKHGRSKKENLLGQKMIEVYPGIESTSMFELLNQVMEDRKPRSMENLFEYSATEKCWFDIFVEPHAEGVLIRSIDITNRKTLETSLLHIQKMEAIGRLAGGIAHDFNNKLGVMQIFCDMSLSQIKPGNQDVVEYLGHILKAIHQSSSLTKQLLAFSRKQVMDLKVISLNELIETVRESLAKVLGESIKLEIFTEKNLGNVRVDPSQIDQVLLNLCINGKDAISGNGVLTIETANIHLNEVYCETHGGVIPGDYVMLSVSDTGSGMPPEIKSKIFEPFFTTKGVGKGTGLGLSTVQGIVAQSRGHIWVYSEVGKGTAFKMYFPLIKEKRDIRKLDNDFQEELKGTEFVLLVEDDPLLQIGFETTLKNAGYKVVSVSSAEEAEKLFDEYKNRFDILLTDIILPGANGNELSIGLLKKNPNLKVIFVSGYTENSIVHHTVLDTDSIILQKPTSSKKLLQTMRQVLDGKIKKGII